LLGEEAVVHCIFGWRRKGFAYIKRRKSDIGVGKFVRVNVIVIRRGGGGGGRGGGR
jgi:hypothetical protein